MRLGPAPAVVIVMLSVVPCGYCAALSLPNQSLSIGEIASAPVSFTSGGQSVSGIQFDLQWDPSITIQVPRNALIGHSDKALYTASISPNRVRCLIIGMNQSILTDGALVQLSLAVASGASPTAATVTLTNTLATDPNGSKVDIQPSTASVSLKQNQVSRAVFRDPGGAIQMTTFGANTLSQAGGLFASDPSVAEDTNGNVFITARDVDNSVWANVYNSNSSVWANWSFAGGIIQGVPAIAVDTGGKAWLASRDRYNSYWLVSYSNGAGFGSWIPLSGVFSTDPLITSCSDGSIYLIGKDNYNSLWSGNYIPGAGFQGWQFGGGVIKGNPSATCGSDSAVYIAAEDNFNSNWIARVSGNQWTGWYYIGAITSVTPRIAALGTGSVAVVILDPTGVVWMTTFTEGPDNGSQPWIQVGGVLQDLAASAINGQLYLAGKGQDGALWWWQQPGNQWTLIGNIGTASGSLSATPR